METTLILLKPDAVTKGLCGTVIERFEKAGFKIRGAKMQTLSDEKLAEHYAHIAHLPFFPDIVEFMQSSPVIAMALEADNAIQRVRDLLGPTNSAEAPEGTIRDNATSRWNEFATIEAMSPDVKFVSGVGKSIEISGAMTLRVPSLST